MDRLLVYGFVRQIENTLDDKIIPLDIYYICFDFYFSSKFIFYLASLSKTQDENPWQDYMQNTMSIANADTKKQWNCNVFKLSEMKTNILQNKHNNQWTVDSAGICFARNLKLPHYIGSTTHNGCMKFNNVVFMCGGFMKKELNTSYTTSENGSNHCSALIVDSHQFENNKTENISAFQWDLPRFPVGIGYNYILYSYGQRALFNFGGTDRRYAGADIDSIYKLSFDVDQHSYNAQNDKQWQWNKLDIKMKENKGNVCCAMIDKETKAIIAGGCSGSTHLKTVQILDFTEEKWIDNIQELHHQRMDAGIYYDEVNDVCYVGGGFANSAKAKRFVECYDFRKNLWSVLPETNLAHDMNPMIWIEENNMLHIMSVLANGIEYIDLRELKKWNITNNRLEELFEQKFDCDDVGSSRIVGN